MPESAADLRSRIAIQKEKLDRPRHLSVAAVARLDRYYNIETTHTSTALESNTLSAVETTLVIEHGITVGGKSLKDHLEVIDHFDAVGYVVELARNSNPITEANIRNLHSLVVLRSAPEIAGRCVRPESGRHAFPPPVQIPSLEGNFAAWLREAPETPEPAFSSLRWLVNINLLVTATDARCGC